MRGEVFPYDCSIYEVVAITICSTKLNNMCVVHVANGVLGNTC